MFPPFPEEAASEVLSLIINDIRSGNISLKRCAPPSDGRDTSSVMAGVLVCRDFYGNIINLISLSGISCSLEGPLPGIFVQPVASPEKVEKALAQNDKEIHELTEKIKNLESKGGSKEETASLKKHRLNLCDKSLRKVFDLYDFYCADGVSRPMMNILKGKLPPTGTGDCCAPKLLSYAFEHELTPASLAESKLHFSMEKVSDGSPVAAGGCERSAKGGRSGGNAGTTKSISLTPPCDIRCGLILPHILGLRILYRDQHIIVVNKQSGVLSVPGRGPDKQDCIVNRVKRLFPDCIEQPAVHRLDMETSGILVLAFTKEAHRELNRQFEMRETSKKYEALVDGVLAKKGIPTEGQMELFFRLDPDNRPHQIWDDVNGKNAVTQWRTLRVEPYTAPDGTRRPVTRIEFIPHTGRTHQLRLAAADSHGFGLPIIGDTLYGRCDDGERLLLHATDLSFTHPITGEAMHFHCPAEF